jgi:ATP-dependent RNA/DNA helicase IGHMBP2
MKAREGGLASEQNRMTAEVKDHFQRLKHLLDLEAEAEKQETLRLLQRRSPAEAEASGNSLINLVIRDESAGLGGRFLLSLSKRSHNQPLPWTRLGVGSPVILSEEGLETGKTSAQGWRGVVSQVSRDSIQIAFQDWPEPQAENPVFRLDRSYDEVSRNRQRQAMDKVMSASEGRLADIRDILLGRQPPIFHDIDGYQPINENLNQSQNEAVRFALTAEDLGVIHGPPGTGKTTTVVELIRQLTKRDQTVLACAPSNLGVDNMLEKLIAAGENAIRIGHPARVLPELRAHTLDLLVENHPDVRLAQKLAREAHALRRKASKYTRARPEPGARQSMRHEAREMLRESRKIIDQVVERLLDKAQVLCATTTGLDRDFLGGRYFDWCVMDEASQSTEPAAWIPMLRSGRLVLAGDHFQLPPTVVSPEAAREGFNISLLERLMKQYGKRIARRLTVQYRMHRDIMTFSSGELYENSLEAHTSVESHLLRDLAGIADNELTNTPVLFIDTAGASFDEAVEPDGESRLNHQEAEVVVRKVLELVESGIKPTQIAVIAPYSAQVRLLRERIRLPELEIDSVDGFQGREKEAVLVSLVRSNSDGEIGFLGDVRRMNVALTRARRKLVVIGDSATVTQHPFYQRMVDYFDKIGAYRSIWEEEWSR